MSANLGIGLKQTGKAALSTCSMILGLLALAALGHLERQVHSTEIHIKLS